MSKKRTEGNRIEKINNAKYIVIINGKEYPVFFSYGLRKKLFDLITNSYINTVEKFKEDSGKDEGNKVDVARDLKTLEEYDNMSYEIVSLVLTQRDDEGKIVDDVSIDRILYSKDFIEADDIFEEIYHLVMEKYQETSKKNVNLINALISPVGVEKAK